MKQHSESSLVITMPTWVDKVVSDAGDLRGDEARMDLVIRLAQMNAERGGGPFGAAVFLGDACVAAAVNRVLDTQLTIAHAEVLALMRAQQALAKTTRPFADTYTLVTSTDPCCQCFGAIVWSEVTRLVCGASTADAEAVGFDEGPKPPNWEELLERRAIAVTRGVLNGAARKVLESYRQMGGRLY